MCIYYYILGKPNDEFNYELDCSQHNGKYKRVMKNGRKKN